MSMCTDRLKNWSENNIFNQCPVPMEFATIPLRKQSTAKRDECIQKEVWPRYTQKRHPANIVPKGRPREDITENKDAFLEPTLVSIFSKQSINISFTTLKPLLPAASRYLHGIPIRTLFDIRSESSKAEQTVCLECIYGYSKEKISL